MLKKYQLLLTLKADSLNSIIQILDPGRARLTDIKPARKTGTGPPGIVHQGIRRPLTIITEDDFTVKGRPLCDL
jgi:hypothetical protein